VSYIQELKQLIRELYGTDSTHVDTVPVNETFQGKTVWAGMVEVFELHDHPKATHAYAWAHETDNPEFPIRHITVLKIPPVESPVTAVRAAISQELSLAENSPHSWPAK
jgi:hypothetical protein